ncbi:MAG TPA: Shedu anti-phage system protein SduA domain-containing protein [Solirubrobacteraceae bacterium]|jgi:hypothetical protein|nr:Shedu anti-phage system protein SduA domain-containing protein [Solirubrobacteraceae bacterium]
MGEEKISQRGIPYVKATLKKKARVVTEAALWKIKHRSGSEELSLKLGRYTLVDGKRPEIDDPKSELTLDPDELAALVRYLEENLEPFRAGARKWIALDKELGPAQVAQLKTLFANPDQQQLVKFLSDHEILPTDLVNSLTYHKRCRAVKDLEDMLVKDLAEQPWQRWFQENDWVLGSEFVRILDDRHIDTEHIADYLMQAYDGFLDLVEIKRPEGALKFWSDALDHGNLVPHSDLVKAITQASHYIFEVERKANSDKFIRRVGGVRAIKPRCVLIYGRSRGWTEDQRAAYRILNASYFNLTILTFDHVLARAKRMLAIDDEATQLPAKAEAQHPDTVPF